MFNPIKYIREIIDILRNPPGEAMYAMEITDESIYQVIALLDEPHKKYANPGDFVVEFENDTTTIVPRDEFFKHYAFAGEPSKNDDPLAMYQITTIKPL